MENEADNPRMADERHLESPTAKTRHKAAQTSEEQRTCGVMWMMMELTHINWYRQ
jgi:hypothetical protein